MKIAGCVVLYNPLDECLSNIDSYIGLVDVLYVLDNSTDHNPEFVEKIKRIDKAEYIGFGANKGIAYALKVGVGRAAELGYDFCLTMDQDSLFPTVTRAELERRFGEIENLEDYGIIGLNFNSDGKEKKLVEIDCWLTSGNFINLSNYKLIDGFYADLFIDYVDVELNEQFRNIGKKIAYWNDLSLSHKIGEPVQHSFFGKKFTVMNHSPLRLYYRFRNARFLYKRNKKFYGKLYRHDLFIDIPKIILFERDKRAKLKMIKKGRADAKRGILGEYNHAERSKS